MRVLGVYLGIVFLIMQLSSCKCDYKSAGQNKEISEKGLQQEYDLARLYLFYYYHQNKCISKCCKIEGSKEEICHEEYLNCVSADFILFDFEGNDPIRISGDTVRLGMIHCDLDNPNCRHLPLLNHFPICAVYILRSQQKIFALEFIYGLIEGIEGVGTGTRIPVGINDIVNHKGLYDFMVKKPVPINNWFYCKYFEYRNQFKKEN